MSVPIKIVIHHEDGSVKEISPDRFMIIFTENGLPKQEIVANANGEFLKQAINDDVLDQAYEQYMKRLPWLRK